MPSLTVPKFLLKNGKWINIKKINTIDIIKNKWIDNNNVTYFLKENLDWIEFKNGIKTNRYEEILTEFNYVLMYSEKAKTYNILTSSDLFSGKSLHNMSFIDEGKWDLTIEDNNDDQFQSQESFKVENETFKTKWLKLDGGNSYYIKENYSWIEKYENDSIAGIFEEIHFNSNYIILFDSKRNFFVKLTDDVAYWGLNANIMFYLANGKWKEKEIKLEEINSDNIKKQFDNIKQALDTEPVITSFSYKNKFDDNEKNQILNEPFDNKSISIDSIDKVEFEQYSDYFDELNTEVEPIEYNTNILNDSIDQFGYNEFTDYFEVSKTEFADNEILDESIDNKRLSINSIDKKSISNDSIDQALKRSLDNVQSLVNLNKQNKIVKKNNENICNSEILDKQELKIPKASIDNDIKPLISNQKSIDYCLNKTDLPVNHAVKNLDPVSNSQRKTEYIKTKTLKKTTHIRIGLNFKMN
jgi:hypothetical protein